VEGIAYVRHNKVLLGAISLDLFAVLLGGATAMLPVYARDVLHVGVEGLGPLRAAPSAGAVLMAVLLASRPLRRHVGPIMFGSVALFGLATIVFGLSTSYPLSLAALAVLGAADAISVFVRGSLIQLHTPDDMRGRVSSVSGLFISASNELGELESGLAARYIGAVPGVVIGGIVVRPAPLMKLTTPGGKTLAYTSIVQMCARPPTLGSFITTELPIRIAGISVQYVSLNG
jgi:MFS family permease